MIHLRMVPRRALSGLALLAAAGSVALGADPAGAVTTVSNRAVAGVQGAVGCLSATRCVVVGTSRRGVGDIVPVVAGVAGQAVTVKGSTAINDVSCVAGSGCVAVGTTTSGVGTLMVPLGRGGKVGKPVAVKTPAGVDLDSLSCASKTSCEVAGIDTSASPTAVAVAAWNGHRLTVHRVAGITSATAHVADISCVGRSCLVVGDATNGSSLIGLTLRVKSGKPARLARHPGDLLSSVACVSAVRCYATGSTSTSGVVQTLDAGVIVRSATVASAPQAIACAGQSCTAVGEENPPAGAPAGTTFYGAIVGLTSGVVSSTASVDAVDSYTDVAMPNRTRFVAVGTASTGKTSEITSG